MNNNLSFPNAIVFDWDNTLIDSWNIILKSINTTFNNYNIPTINMSEAKNNIFQSMREVFPKIFGDKYIEAADDYRNNYRIYRENNIKLLPYALDFIELAYKKNIYLSIVSNKSGDFLREEVNMLDINKYFRTIIGAMDAESDKPSISPMMLAMKNSGININKDIWYIGDTIGDMDFADNVGCAKIFYGCDFNDSIKTKYNDVNHFNNYHNLISFLKNISNC